MVKFIHCSLFFFCFLLVESSLLLLVCDYEDHDMLDCGVENYNSSKSPQMDGNKMMIV